MDYRDYQDDELISYIHENNEEANDIIFEKYEPLIISIAKRFLPYSKGYGLELGDFVQEGRLGLHDALQSYNAKSNNSFYTFAKTCIERKMISFLLQANRLKHRILNESVSYEVEPSQTTGLTLSTMLEDKKANPEELLLNREAEEDLITRIKNSLTDYEAQVFELRLNDFQYREIAEILDREPKAIDNALQRIRIKVKEAMKDEEN